MSSNALEWLRENREKGKLVVYFVVILALAGPIVQMVGRGWQAAHLTRIVLRLRLLVGLTLDQVSLLALGVYLALLTLMLIDHKKRVQAVLLWVGTLVTLAGLATMDVFLPNVNPVGNAPWLVAGGVIGIALGGGKKLQGLLDPDAIRTLEFRRASEGVYVLIVLVTVLTFLELHLVYPALFRVNRTGVSVRANADLVFGLNGKGFVVDLVATTLFIAVTNRFIKYDADHDFFVLGPRASGKSLFLIGAYLEALERERGEGTTTPLEPSQDLMSMIEQLDRSGAEWIVEATGRGEIKYLSFQYVHGSVFPTNIQLSGIDYAGEYLERLPDAITGTLDESESDTTLRRLSERVKGADTLIMVIDVERFVNEEPLDIAEYFSILQAADNKNVFLVATKADFLADEFESKEGLEAHRYYDDFVEYVNQRLRQNENINSLVTEVGDTEIHPVYYQTTEDENGNRVPMRDDTGSVLTVGFDPLLDKLGRV